MNEQPSSRPSPGASDQPGGSAPTGVPLNPGDEAPEGTPGTGPTVCRRCGGSGRIAGQPCENCAGRGKVVKGIGGA
ncbi:MAG TPA: hypothetical protein VGP22_16135 [Albitalea sp.]|nr:hypothetical protein [Albitalea sp.]